jgi:hypothetical protein
VFIYPNMDDVHETASPDIQPPPPAPAQQLPKPQRKRRAQRALQQRVIDELTAFNAIKHHIRSGTPRADTNSPTLGRRACSLIHVMIAGGLEREMVYNGWYAETHSGLTRDGDANGDHKLVVAAGTPEESRRKRIVSLSRQAHGYDSKLATAARKRQRKRQRSMSPPPPPAAAATAVDVDVEV